MITIQKIHRLDFDLVTVLLDKNKIEQWWYYRYLKAMLISIDLRQLNKLVNGFEIINKIVNFKSLFLIRTQEV